MSANVTVVLAVSDVRQRTGDKVRCSWPVFPLFAVLAKREAAVSGLPTRTGKTRHPIDLLPIFFRAKDGLVQTGGGFEKIGNQ